MTRDERAVAGGKPGVEPSHSSITVRAACTDLIHAFAHLIDNGRAIETVDLFAEIGSLGSSRGTNKGKEALRAVMEQRQAMSERRTCHVVSNIVFTSLESDSPKASSVLTLYLLGENSSAAPRAISRFDDEFVRSSGGRWMFLSRIASLLAGAP
jgi:hypothetical protein